MAKVKAMQLLQQQVGHRNETSRLHFRPSELGAEMVASAGAKAMASAARAKAEPLHRALPAWPLRSSEQPAAAASTSRNERHQLPTRAAPRGGASTRTKGAAPLLGLPAAQKPNSRSSPAGSRGSACEQGAGAAKPPSSVLSASKLSRMALGHNLSAPQERAYRRVFRLLQTGGRVAMVAIGGSMVGGAKCHDGPLRGVWHELECAYVSRFGRWLQRSYGCTGATGPEAGNAPMHERANATGPRIAYHNRAQGGTTSISSLPHLPYVVGSASGPNQDGPADLLVVDYSVYEP